MDIEAFENGLKKEILPIYTFLGNQPFLLDMMVGAIREKVAVGPFADMNCSIYHGDEKGAFDKALQDAEQFPMMAQMRLVIIREAESIKGKNVDRLAEYLLSPNKSTCLVLCFSKLAKNTKVWKRSNKNGLGFTFDKIYERQMPFWIKQMAKNHEKTITPKGADFLIRAIGANLEKANAEIEKAALYVGEGKTIDADDFEAVLAAIKSESIFEITDSIGKRDITWALYLIKKMLDSGEKPLNILWQVGNHMRRLMLVKSMVVDNAPIKEIGRAMGVMDFVRDKLAAQSKVFKRKELRLSLVTITKADLELKSGRISNRVVLEKLILDLCRSQKARS